MDDDNGGIDDHDHNALWEDEEIQQEDEEIEVPEDPSDDSESEQVAAAISRDPRLSAILRSLFSTDRVVIDDAPPRQSNVDPLSALLRRYNLRGSTRPTPSDSVKDERDPAGWSSAIGGYKDSSEPTERGSRLLLSGEFGRVYRRPRSSHGGRELPSAFIRGLQSRTRRLHRAEVFPDLVPNTSGTIVATYGSNAYVGQFSADSSLFYTCCQDFDLHLYDADAPIKPVSRTRNQHSDHVTSMKLRKTIQGAAGQWTITDSHLNPDNSSLIYSTLTSTIQLAKTQEGDEEQIPIYMGDRASESSGWYSTGIYSCRFSRDGKEVVAGGRQGYLYVYDLGAMKRSLKIRAHGHDINSCCWADTSSGNVLVSASDDTTLRVWDRRSLGSSPKPSGMLIGHTEGITHVGPKGDGRYVISNGKDQVLRMWDLRKMRSHTDWEGENRYSNGDFDYRHPSYPKPAQRAHPLDTSVMEYKGHRVFMTLIRCHFSPGESTGHSYIYSGSSDGRIHIWSLDGRVVQVLDRSRSLPMSNHPSDTDTVTSRGSSGQACVRDVSWNTHQPVLLSCAWERHQSSVARHEWKGFGKNAMSLEDVVERERQNMSHDY